MAIEFISMVNLELNMVEEISEPPTEVYPGEEIVGEVPEELRRLYTLWRQTGKSAGSIDNELRWGSTDPAAQEKAAELAAKAQVLHLIFWISVQDELKLWHIKETLAVRKGFKVVKCATQETPIFKFNLGEG